MINETPRFVKDFDGLADLCDENFAVVRKHVNKHEDLLKDLCSDVKELFADTGDLAKRCRRKASKLGLIVVVAAGIAYIVKNELDKQDMNRQLIAMDKEQRFGYGPEDEGEALDPASN